MVMAFFSVIVLAYWFYKPVTVIEYLNTPFPTTKQEYSRGEMVEYEIAWCKYKEIPAEVQFRLLELNEDLKVRTGYLLETYVSGNVFKGCGKVFSKLPPIPEYVQNGEYTFEILVQYDVNPVRKVTASGRTQNFSVID